MIRLIFFIAVIIIVSCNSPVDNHATTTLNDSSQQTNIPSQQKATSIDSNFASPESDSLDKTNENTIIAAKNNINKATVSLTDSLLTISASKFKDHRFFGYSQPDAHSKRMILFSVFTNDVEGNPFHCPYGAYYGTNNLNDLSLKYETDGDRNFMGFAVLKNKIPQDTVYIEKKWIDIEK